MYHHNNIILLYMMYSVVHALTVLLFHFSSDFYLVLRYYQKKMHLRSVLQLDAGLFFTLLLLSFFAVKHSSLIFL